MLARVPFLGPRPGSSIRLGRIEGKLVAFPTAEELENSDLDLIVSSTEKAVVMIEGFGEELPEPEMAEAIMVAHRLNQELISLQNELIAAVGLPPHTHPPVTIDPLRQTIYERYGEQLRETKQIVMKAERNAAAKTLLNTITKELVPTDPHAAPPRASVPDADDAAHGDSAPSPVPADVEVTPGRIKAAFSAVEERVVRELILDGKRPDGRGPKDLRSIKCEVGLLPRAHGSALFQRGETQALVTTVLGTGADEQRVDGIMDEYTKKFMLDYNMPSFAVGEVRPIRGPGRREIGHGALAERSVASILPGPSRFPYTIRVVSDILESNGSSSMASVCGATLSLMDAGVPITDPVGGISIGLVQDESAGRHILLTDIIGDEDHFGDMDFKVAGTQRGVTGIQLDLKNHGITEEIIRETLEQAREARLEILRAMLRSIKRPREEISANAPRLIQIQINPEKIGMVIGPGGKTIRRLGSELLIGGQKSRTAAHSPGTVLEVRTCSTASPMRRAFLKSDMTESGHVADMFSRIARWRTGDPASPIARGKGCLTCRQCRAASGSRFSLAANWPSRYSGWKAGSTTCSFGATSPTHHKAARRRGQFLFIAGRFTCVTARSRTRSNSLSRAPDGRPDARGVSSPQSSAGGRRQHPSDQDRSPVRDSQRIYSHLLSTLRQTFLKETTCTRGCKRAEPATSKLANVGVATTPGCDSSSRRSWVPPIPAFTRATASEGACGTAGGPTDRQAVGSWFQPSGPRPLPEIVGQPVPPPANASALGLPVGPGESFDEFSADAATATVSPASDHSTVESWSNAGKLVEAAASPPLGEKSDGPAESSGVSISARAAGCIGKLPRALRCAVQPLLCSRPFRYMIAI